MSYSSNLALGEIAYDGFHAIDDQYLPFEQLSEEDKERWAQGAHNACEAWIEPGGVDVERWRKQTRAKKGLICENSAVVSRQASFHCCKS